MKIWGITMEQVHQIVNDVSRDNYQNNLEIDQGGLHSPPRKIGKAIAFCLRVKDSKGPGHALVGPSQKRWVSACWHCHRDVCIAIFNLNPDARIKTAIADYRGKWDFNYSFPATGSYNIGSVTSPVHMSHACEC